MFASEAWWYLFTVLGAFCGNMIRQNILQFIVKIPFDGIYPTGSREYRFPKFRIIFSMLQR